MFEQTFKNIDDVLWKEAGCTTELVGKSYDFIIDETHRRSSWAAPQKVDGMFDPNSALTKTSGSRIQKELREMFPNNYRKQNRPAVQFLREFMHENIVKYEESSTDDDKKGTRV